jgi:hypothetical protein
MRHGQGKFFYQDGGMYDGNWKFNKMDGYGKLYYQVEKLHMKEIGTMINSKVSVKNILFTGKLYN